MSSYTGSKVCDSGSDYTYSDTSQTYSLKLWRSEDWEEYYLKPNPSRDLAHMIPLNPFLIVPDNNICILKPESLWEREDHATYFFSFPYDRSLSFFYVG